jgi:hypothetical protein
MFFAIIQDNDRNDNPPFAACGETEAEVAGKICDFMYDAYEMPKTITTLDEASCWFSGCVEDGEDSYADGTAYNDVYSWDSNNM